MKPRQRLSTTREQSTFTLAPHTISRLSQLASLTSLSRGRLIDLAIDCLRVCDECEGEGRVEDGTGHTDPCSACRGHRLMPVEVMP